MTGQAGSNRSDAGTTPRKKQILIAEDNADLSRIFAIAFNYHQFEVSVARDGAETLRLLDETPPDVLVLDMNMPSASGVDVLNYMQTRDDLKAIEVIVVTGNYQWQFDPAIDNVSLFLMKPVDISELVLFAQRLVAREQEQSQA